MTHKDAGQAGSGEQPTLADFVNRLRGRAIIALGSDSQYDEFVIVENDADASSLVLICTEYESSKAKNESLSLENATLREQIAVLQATNNSTHSPQGHQFRDAEMMWNERCVNCGAQDREMGMSPCGVRIAALLLYRKGP